VTSALTILRSLGHSAKADLSLLWIEARADRRLDNGTTNLDSELRTVIGFVEVQNVAEG
jgi:hypothetical protein